MSTKDLQKMVQALPQYSEQIDKLSLHVEVGRSFVMQSWYHFFFAPIRMAVSMVRSYGSHKYICYLHLEAAYKRPPTVCQCPQGKILLHFLLMPSF